MLVDVLINLVQELYDPSNPEHRDCDAIEGY